LYKELEALKKRIGTSCLLDADYELLKAQAEVGQFHEQLARQVFEITFSEGRKSRFGSGT